jgi:hypothetical protein
MQAWAILKGATLESYWVMRGDAVVQ